jgi:hypothetical protein
MLTIAGEGELAVNGIILIALTASYKTGQIIFPL